MLRLPFPQSLRRVKILSVLPVDFFVVRAVHYAEADARIDDLALSSLTEDRLVELMEKAVSSCRPERLVAAELGLGFVTGRQLLSVPPATARDEFGAHNQYGPPMVTQTVRNSGD